MRVLIFGIFVALILTASPLAIAQDEARAQQAFAQAQQLAAAARYDEALDLYREAHRLAPANAAPILGIGVCLFELGSRNYRESLEMLDRYLDIGRNPESRSQAQQLINTILGQLGLATVAFTVSPQGAEVSVDGDSVPAHRLDRVRVEAGSIDIEARAAGYERVEYELNVVAGSTNPVNLTLHPRASGTSQPTMVNPLAVQPTPAPRARRPVYRRWWFWTIIGTAVAGGVAAGLAVGLTQDDVPDGWRWEI